MLKTAGKDPRKLLPATEIPDFKDDAEAAQWFDTHDTSELSLEEVADYSEGGPAARLETVAVRVSIREIAELRRRAAGLGVGHTTYVRMLINRHVLDEPPLGAKQ